MDEHRWAPALALWNRALTATAAARSVAGLTVTILELMARQAWGDQA